MEYKGYIVSEKNDCVVVENVKDFDPVQTFECGQCFRWLKQPDGSYTGVVENRAGNIRCENGNLIIKGSTIKDFKDIWFDYLDLGRDYSEIKNKLLKDEIMEKAIAEGYGIRLLKQDLWETLISFIISANNRIPMIMKVVEAISQMYGDKIEFSGGAYCSFPDVSRLSSSNIEQLQLCKGGFRCNYILKTSEMVMKGEIDLNNLRMLGTDEARELLTKLPGVGNKVADCTLLYSGTKYDVFPTDVWVKRVMEELYFKRETTLREIQDFAKDYFGELAGFAQQYLFYYARKNKIGV